MGETGTSGPRVLAETSEMKPYVDLSLIAFWAAREQPQPQIGSMPYPFPVLLVPPFTIATFAIYEYSYYYYIASYFVRDNKSQPVGGERGS